MQTLTKTHQTPRRLLHLLSAFLIAVALVGCAAIDPQHVLTRRMGNETPAQGAALDAGTRQQAYEFVWNRVNEAYVDPKFNGVDWVRAGERHMGKILEAANDDIFWKSMDGMLAELGDAHTRVLSPKQYAFDKDKQNLTLGLSLALIDGEVVVTGVAKESPADKAGLQKGNRLVTIGTEAASDWWSRQFNQARKNSTDRARLKTVKRVFNGGDPESPADNLSLIVERNDGSNYPVTLTRAVIPRKDTLTSKLLENNLGYIRLTGFDPKLSRDIRPVFDVIKDSQGLVVDLRGNGGGSLGLALSFMNQLVTGRVPVGKRVTRTGKPPAFFMGLLTVGRMDLELSGVAKPYLGPLVILVDGDSASGSEFFSGSLQAIGRAKVVGETTCGCLLGYMGYANVPGGGGLAYSELDFAPVRGPRIEGLGVQPDHIVTPRRQDLIEGKDPVLERAIQVLRGT